MTDAQNQPGGSDFAQQPGGFTAQPGPPVGYRRRPGSRAGRSRRQRGNWPWTLAILLVAAVAALPVIIAVVHTNSSVDALARVRLPEGGLITLPHAGGNVIYYEDDRSGSSTAGDVPAFDLTITPVSAGAAVAGLAARSNSSYSFGGHHGVEVFTVQVTHPGQFRISVTGPAGPLSSADLAIGPGVPIGLFILGIVATILVAICGIGILVVLIFRKFGRESGANPGAGLLEGLRRMRQMQSEMRRDQ